MPSSGPAGAEDQNQAAVESYLGGQKSSASPLSESKPRLRYMNEMLMRSGLIRLSNRRCQFATAVPPTNRN